uniref:Gsp-co-occurring protein 15 n=1 Tax=Malawimonas jakobiformis TaxID=136089 RepID=A0A895KRU5_MALJA|nr:Gsp-co-occurring protein 15 [Malawimonas jakobiformis]
MMNFRTIIAALLGVASFFGLYSFRGRNTPLNRSHEPRTAFRAGRGVDPSAMNQFASVLKSFLESGGISHVFPGDTARDTSVQFELISQVTGVTTVGRPISVTLRNAPTNRSPYSSYPY